MGRRRDDQLCLDLPPAPAMGDHACGDQSARLIAEGIKRSGKSRARVAAEMTDLLGVTISIAMLNAWSAPSKPQHRMPAEYLGAFCFVVNDARLIALFAGQAGFFVITQAERAQLEVLDLDEELKELRRKKRDLQRVAERRRRR